MKVRLPTHVDIFRNINIDEKNRTCCEALYCRKVIFHTLHVKIITLSCRCQRPKPLVII